MADSRPCIVKLKVFFPTRSKQKWQNKGCVENRKNPSSQIYLKTSVCLHNNFFAPFNSNFLPPPFLHYSFSQWKICLKSIHLIIGFLYKLQLSHFFQLLNVANKGHVNTHFMLICQIPIDDINNYEARNDQGLDAVCD